MQHALPVPQTACLGFTEAGLEREQGSNLATVALGEKELSMVSCSSLQGHDESETPASPAYSPVEEDPPIFPVATQETNGTGGPDGKWLT